MLALKIALRYLIAPKSHRAVNVISIISVVGVAVATMAIVVVLSVFNGFSDLARRQLSRIDPDLRVQAAEGKVFARADSIADVIQTVAGVRAAMPVLRDRALLVADRSQMPVRFVAVDPAKAAAVLELDSIIIDGIYSPDNGLPDSVAGAQISVGVALSTGLRPSPYAAGDIYVPRRLGRINPANPAAAYRCLPVAVTGVTQVDQQDYDNDYVILPLGPMRELLEYSDGEASSVEIALASGGDVGRVRRRLEQTLPQGLVVLDRDEQSSDTYRMIAIEKWVTFLMLVFILVIASFNIISTLSLLVIEKRDNMATLRALGAPRGLIARIFVDEGWLITVSGGLVGIAVGIVLVLLQQHFGLIRLEGDPSTLNVDSYPVRLVWGDVALLLGTVVVLGFIISQISRLFSRKI